VHPLFGLSFGTFPANFREQPFLRTRVNNGKLAPAEAELTPRGRHRRRNILHQPAAAGKRIGLGMRVLHHPATSFGGLLICRAQVRILPGAPQQVSVLQVILATPHLAPPPQRARSAPSQQDLHHPVLLQSLWQRGQDVHRRKERHDNRQGQWSVHLQAQPDCCGWTEDNRYGQGSWRQYLRVHCAPLGDGVLEETIRLPHRAGAHP
jgi:hypothetical protein